MNPRPPNMTESGAPPTPLDHLARSLRARASVPSGQEGPAAILWTDPGAEWRALIPAALPRIPELLVLGDYRPEHRTGPAIWLRCVVDRAIDDPDLPHDCPPIIYLPGVERGRLRAGEDCPGELRPLVELMYRGVLWHHPNGREWTVAAFLRSPKGPGIDIATDRGTNAALLGALDQVALAPVDRLRGRRLDAADFNRMAGVDVSRDILRWMGDPERMRFRLDDNRWNTFRTECQSELGFDPETEADVSAGALLGRGEGRWADVWARFSEAPAVFRGVPDVLARSRPAGVLQFDRARWPDLNDEEEESVRSALALVPGLSHADGCAEVARLEEEHRHRRDWVWAHLGRSPLAAVLEPLAKLAESARTAIGGATPDDAAEAYADRGWPADASAREALALAPAEHEETIATSVRHLIAPWLDDSARALQSAIDRAPLPAAADRPEVTAGEDECIVFVDGLRYELGRRLADRLETRGCAAVVDHRWAATPTVTATAKPAVTPVAGDIAGDRLGADFRPTMEDSGRPARAKDLRDAMEERGYQILGSGALDIPLSAGARGWLETGEVDRHGHHHGAAAFARLVEDELVRLADRIAGLLDVGWRSVRVVTDHGWLLLPGGLPLATLPRHLTESKWARCAVVAPGSKPDARLHPWHWNPDEHFATPPGIACFSKRDEYAHGGLSIQECLIPDIRVERTVGNRVTATIRSVSWRRFRCNVAVRIRGVPAADPPPLTADLRLGTPAGESVASSPKPIDADGLASLVLADDRHEDADLVLVVTDADGRVLAQQPTRTGDKI